MHSSRAFTLVELMVTIAVLAVILSIAVPSFSNLILANRAQTQTNLLINAFNLARSEAIKRGTAVRVSALNNGNWHLGWRVWVDSNGNSTFDNGELLRLFPAWEGSNTLISLTTQVVFSSAGRRTDVGASNNFALSVGSSYCRYERVITVNAVGRATVTPRVCAI
jgi:type IV fimbrial biogenesis protein FimT